MFKSKVVTLLNGILIGVPITITFLDCIGYVAKVEGVSMQPVLNPDNESNSQDYVLLNRWTVRSFNVHRGDIVSLVSPRDPEQLIIKRVIAIEGDTIKTISWKHRYVNIPQGHCWVEGDHLQKSMDSNVFGPVALGLITAKASHIVWPPQRWQKLVNHIPTGRSPTRGLYSHLQSEFAEMQDLLNADEDEI